MSAADALPAYHHRERHSIFVAATPEHAFAAARETQFDDVPLVRLLMKVRGLRSAPREAIWDALLAEGFQAVGDDTVVLVGKPWSPSGGTRTPDDFADFAEPGYAKVAMDIRARPGGGGSRLETETRVFLTSGSARRRFAAYWLVVRPFSGLVRRSWLKAAKRRAEAVEE
jgi:hypothetical protein